jgi:hypothetical protein
MSHESAAVAASGGVVPSSPLSLAGPLGHCEGDGLAEEDAVGVIRELRIGAALPLERLKKTRASARTNGRIIIVQRLNINGHLPAA